MKLKDEMARLRDGLIFEQPQLPPPDDHVATLIARGERTAAIRYCKEMYNECLRNKNPQRADEYLAFVDPLQQEPDALDPRIGI